MTATEMVAGRALDAQIARRVFGLCAVVTPGKPWWPNGSLDGHVRTQPDGTGGRTYLPHYSTKIEDAWRVVEHLRTLGFAPLLMFEPTDGDASRPCQACLIRTYAESIVGQEIEAWADTMPLAICRVSLKAMAECARVRTKGGE